MRRPLLPARVQARLAGESRYPSARTIAAVVVVACLVATASAVGAGSGSTANASASGLVAAYSFNDGSGPTTADVSGNGHPGTISGASWTTDGRYGGALSFDGTDDRVDLGSLGTFYQSGFTMEAWVKKATDTKKDVAVLGTFTGGGAGPMIWVDHLEGRYRLTAGIGLDNYLDSGQTPVADTWQHLAVTYDGTVARFYIDGTEVASRTISSFGGSNTWRVGAYDATPFGFFDGVIDEVRIYSRALTAAEIVTDRDEALVGPDQTPPSAPGTLVATGGPAQASLTWGAATDDTGVTRYNVHRSTTDGFTPDAGNRIAQPTDTSYVDSPLSSGTYYYRVTAQDLAGNVGPASNQASATVTGDTTPPQVSITSPTGGTVSGPITVTANASDNLVVAGVQFKRGGQNLGAEDTTAPYSVPWDTRGELNGTHVLTAVARDGVGNTTTSSPVTVTVANAGVSTVGLRAAYALDEGTGTMAVDASNNHNTATLAGGAGWGSGRYGGAVTLNGTASEVDPPALGTFYKTAFTLEAWVLKQSTKVDAGVVGSWVGSQGGGAMIWVDHLTGRYRLAMGMNFGGYVDSGRTPTVGQWQHVAATYDGTTARFYVDGVETASAPYAGNVGDGTSWRIGAYGAPATGFFDGSIDNVRIYDRALSASEIETDAASRIQPDSAAPSVTQFSPAPGATGVSIGSFMTATFDEPMQASTINTTTVRLTDTTNNSNVSASVTYDAATRTARLTPQSALQFGRAYRFTVRGGATGVKDLAGTPMAADAVSTFTTESAPQPILVMSSSSNKFGTYVPEIMRAEGLNAFTTLDVSLMSASILSNFHVVILGDTSLSNGQVTMLTNWVNGGGNLIALRPDKKLASLLGLVTASGNTSNAYMRVNTSTTPGAGITSASMQFHGTADRYLALAATTVATLYSNATTATLYPAVTLRSVGSSGGQAAAFTYDLARSVVYTRQGNPAWAGQERDGVLGVRPDDMFFSTWLDTSKIAIPQADEQQRLLANLVTVMERDRLPVPRFWYLPRGEKAVVVMSGDDHSPTNTPGGTAFALNRFKQLSPPGCVVANWDCVRTSAYIYPDSVLTPAEAAGFVADGFEVGLHASYGGCNATPATPAQFTSMLTTQLGQLAARYGGIPAPVSGRTHCVEWIDWASVAKIEGDKGIRLDANYYHFPGSWIGSAPGFMNGGGFPMRFADTDGTPIDVFQQNTNMNDEVGQAYPATIDALLDNALGPNGYYGAFGANIHNDYPSLNPLAEAIVASAQARGVPIVSYRQMLQWTDGRNASTIGSMSWNAGTFTFTTTVGAGANGLQTLLPTQGPNGTLNSLTCAGSPTSYTVQTIKGVQYAAFTSVGGTCQAKYS
jgi:concanavalin A-like lectin/glucanase superfamily protein/Big-like domain-containing protein